MWLPLDLWWLQSYAIGAKGIGEDTKWGVLVAMAVVETQPRSPDVTDEALT